MRWSAWITGAGGDAQAAQRGPRAQLWWPTATDHLAALNKHQTATAIAAIASSLPHEALGTLTLAASNGTLAAQICCCSGKSVRSAETAHACQLCFAALHVAEAAPCACWQARQVRPPDAISHSHPRVVTPHAHDCAPRTIARAPVLTVLTEARGAQCYSVKLWRRQPDETRLTSTLVQRVRKEARVAAPGPSALRCRRTRRTHTRRSVARAIFRRARLTPATHFTTCSIPASQLGPRETVLGTCCHDARPPWRP